MFWRDNKRIHLCFIHKVTFGFEWSALQTEAPSETATQWGLKKGKSGDILLILVAIVNITFKSSKLTVKSYM